MVNDLKTVPCSIYNPQDPATEGKVTEKHRAILIEWLLEVATEEKYRRYASKIIAILEISILIAILIAVLKKAIL